MMHQQEPAGDSLDSPVWKVAIKALSVSLSLARSLALALSRSVSRSLSLARSLSLRLARSLALAMTFEHCCQKLSPCVGPNASTY